MRWVIRIVGVVLSLVVLAVGALFLLPAERIANLAARQFEAATGRSLVIAGPVRPSIFPMVGARIEQVALANAPWSGQGPMLQAEVVDLGLDLMALMRGDVVVQRFEARAPRILLERDAQGRANWEFDLGGQAAGGSAPAGAPSGTAAGDAAPGGTGAARTISLALAEITGAELRYVDHGADTMLAYSDVDLRLEMPDFSGPGQLRVESRQSGRSFEATVAIGSVERFLAGEVATIAAQLSAGGTQLGFDGRAGLTPLAAEGRLTLEGAGVAPLMALAGAGGAEPLPEAMRPLSLAGQVTLAPAGSVHLRDVALGLGGNRLAMALDLTFEGERPRLTGAVSAPSLDLRALTVGDAPPVDEGSGSGWSREPIDASALGMLDAAVTLDFGPVQTGVTDLDALRGVLTIDRARAVFEISEARLYDGRVAGEVVANNRSGLSVGGNLNIDQVALLPLLRQFAGFERLSGTGSGRVRFLGSGNSLDAIMRSLSGEGRLDMGQGEIIGLDLAGMLRNLDLSYMGEGNRTIYDSLTGGFTIQNGVLRSDDLQMLASLVNVAGLGTIDLGGQALDYRVIPEALRNAETGDALRVPLLITGPWSAPRFRLDLEGLAETRLREEAERLEARAREEAARLEAEARARADEALQQRLGIERQEGQSTEDALRDGAQQRIDDEVGRGLRRLLGGGGGN